MAQYALTRTIALPCEVEVSVDYDPETRRAVVTCAQLKARPHVDLRAVYEHDDVRSIDLDARKAHSLEEHAQHVEGLEAEREKIS